MRLSLILLILTLYIGLGASHCLAQGTIQQDSASQTNSTQQNSGSVSISVAPDQLWTHTGIQIEKGGRGKIEASGTLNWFAGHPEYTSSPAGINCPAPASVYPFPALPCMSLIGKIGDGEAFEVGASYNYVSNVSGELLLGVNDEYLQDNSGGYQATIKICQQCPQYPQPQYGDVVIYWNGGNITHSGYVSEVKDCVVTGINNYSEDDGIVEFNINPDSPILAKYGSWTVYRTDRTSTFPGAPNRWIKTYYHLFLFPFYQGKTDKDIVMIFNNYSGNPLQNCHGYTFAKIGQGIIGYKDNKGNSFYYPPRNNYQGTAVRIILRDNEFYQIHAQGVDDCTDHFNPQYNVSNFKNLPLPDTQ